MSSKDISPWSAHALQITTPEHKYVGNGSNSTDERLQYFGPPLPRCYHSSSMVSSPSGDIFIFGGGEGGRIRNDTWVIRISGDSGSSLGLGRNTRHMEVTANLVETTGETPSPRFGHQSAMAEGLLIIWGGVTSIVDRKPVPPDDNSIYVLDIMTHHWRKLNTHPAPGARDGHAACICSTRFIVFGGKHARLRRNMSDLWSFDLDSLKQGAPKWKQIEVDPGSELPPERRGHVMISYRGKLYVFGGRDSKTWYNDTWSFDMSTRVWTELRCTGPIPPPRDCHAVALEGDAMCISGGRGKNLKDFGDTWSFKIREQKWYRFPSMDSQPSPRHGHTLAATRGCVLLFGGKWKIQDSHGYFERVHILDTDLVEYSQEREQITIKSTRRIEQPGSTRIIDAVEGEKYVGAGTSKSAGQIVKDVTSDGLEDRTIGSETDSIGMSELVAATDNVRLETTVGLLEENSPLDQRAGVPAIPDTITGAMSAAEILQYLVLHGCRDISKELDMSHVSEYPVSSGGFGDVFCATLRNGDRVGLKCVRILVDSTTEGKKYLKRAAHELYVWSKCKHPNILELSGVTLFRGQVAMVSPWVEHGHLRWFLHRHPQADRCMLQCANITDGVSYLHRMGTVHGDLKPENILVANDHIPKLTDFGNAALSEYTLQFSHSTTTQSISMRWTAPEILSEETKATQASDVYALGMIIFEAITGILPYEGAKEPVIMRRILAGQVPSRPETHIPTGIDQADRLWSLITSCWAYDPNERPTAWEVKNVLSGITPEGLLANRS